MNKNTKTKNIIDKNSKKRFVRHFRIYFVNNHPAYIVDETDGNYVFHRTTESKTSGGKKNWPILANPLKMGKGRKLYIIKAEQIDKVGRFSPFELELKKNMDISYPYIKLKKEIKNKK